MQASSSKNRRRRPHTRAPTAAAIPVTAAPVQPGSTLQGHHVLTSLAAAGNCSSPWHPGIASRSRTRLHEPYTPQTSHFVRVCSCLVPRYGPHQGDASDHGDIRNESLAGPVPITLPAEPCALPRFRFQVKWTEGCCAGTRPWPPLVGCNGLGESPWCLSRTAIAAVRTQGAPPGSLARHPR